MSIEDLYVSEVTDAVSRENFRRIRQILIQNNETPTPPENFTLLGGRSISAFQRLNLNLKLDSLTRIYDGPYFLMHWVLVDSDMTVVPSDKVEYSATNQTLDAKIKAPYTVDSVFILKIFVLTGEQ